MVSSRLCLAGSCFLCGVFWSGPPQTYLSGTYSVQVKTLQQALHSCDLITAKELGTTVPNF